MQINKVCFERDFGPEQGYIREFIPEGESVYNWSKMITIEFFENEERAAREYVEEFKATRERQCPGSEFQILSEEEYTVTYRYNFPECQGHMEQSGISRMYEGNDGLHHLSCAEKGTRAVRRNN